MWKFDHPKKQPYSCPFILFSGLFSPCISFAWCYWQKYSYLIETFWRLLNQRELMRIKTNNLLLRSKWFIVFLLYFYKYIHFLYIFKSFSIVKTNKWRGEKNQKYIVLAHVNSLLTGQIQEMQKSDPFEKVVEEARYTPTSKVTLQFQFTPT